MPTSTFDLGTTTGIPTGTAPFFVNDGSVEDNGNTLTPVTYVRYNQNNFMAAEYNYFSSIKKGIYLRFVVASIPKGSSITTATLRIYGALPFSGPQVLNIRVDARGNPPLPTKASQVLNPASIVPTSTQPQVSFTNVATPSNKANHVLKTADVTNLIQQLVTDNDYSSGKMMMYLNTTSKPVAIYAQDWEPKGTTAPQFAGGGGAKLVIDYTAPEPSLQPDRTTYRYG